MLWVKTSPRGTLRAKEKQNSLVPALINSQSLSLVSSNETALLHSLSAKTRLNIAKTLQNVIRWFLQI